MSTPSPAFEPCELTITMRERDVRLHLRSLSLATHREDYCLGHRDIHFRTDGVGLGCSFFIDGIQVMGSDDHWQATLRGAVRAVLNRLSVMVKIKRVVLADSRAQEVFL